MVNKKSNYPLAISFEVLYLMKVKADNTGH